MTKKQRPTYTIYRLEFDDGTHYVGRTTYSVEKRVAQHRMTLCNVRVHDRLRLDMLVRHRVLHTTGDFHESLRLERREIQRLKNPLNSTNVGTVGEVFRYRDRSGRDYSHRNYKPTDRPIRCNLCRRTLEATMFAPTRLRSTGRDGRCKDCAYHGQFLMCRAKRLGFETADGYAEHVSVIREWAKKPTNRHPVEERFERYGTTKYFNALLRSLRDHTP